MDNLLHWWLSIPDGIREKVIAGLIVFVLCAVLKLFWKKIVALWRGLFPAPSAPAPTPPLVVNVNVPQPVAPAPQEKPTLPPSSHPAAGARLPRPPAVGFVARKDWKQRDLVAQLKGELDPGKRAFVVLSGYGGRGKSALAGECARQLESVLNRRVIWSSAEGRSDYSLSTLLDEIASALGDSEARKLALEPKKQRAVELLAPTPCLVVLDNFETIAPAEQTLCTQWLDKDAPCAVLVTSRESLPCALNISLDAMLPDEAREYLDRLIAQAANPRAFKGADRAQIIETAEANPLLLEWIVGQVDLAQDPQQVIIDLKKGKGTAAERVFDRSFNLPQVGEGGHAVLLALSLFSPSASREALAEVAGFGTNVDRLNEALKHLAGLRLVASTAGGRRLLVEGLTREMARNKLAAGGRRDDFRRRFVGHFEHYAGQHALTSPEDFGALEDEKENLLAALAIAFEVKRWHPVVSIRSSLEEYLDLRGYWEEAIRTGEMALQAARELKAPQGIACFAHNLAVVYYHRGEVVKAGKLYLESLEIKRRLGDQSGIAKTLHQLGMLAHHQGSIEEARRLYGESLEIKRKLGDQSLMATTLHQLGMLAHHQGSIEEARRLYGESLEIKRKLGDQSGIAGTLHQLGMLAQQQGDPKEARKLYGQSLEIDRKLGDQRGIAITLHQLGILAQHEGNAEEARRLYGESLEIKRRLGNQSGIAKTLHQLGMLAHDQGNPEEARRLYGESLEIERKLGNQSGIAISLHELGRLAQQQGNPDEARRFYEESLEIERKLGDQMGIAESFGQLGRLAEGEGDRAEAAKLYREALTIFQALGSPYADVARKDLARVAGKES